MPLHIVYQKIIIFTTCIFHKLYIFLLQFVQKINIFSISGCGLIEGVQKTAKAPDAQGSPVR
jgi:hypothetical protein